VVSVETGAGAVDSAVVPSAVVGPLSAVASLPGMGDPLDSPPPSAPSPPPPPLLEPPPPPPPPPVPPPLVPLVPPPPPDDPTLVMLPLVPEDSVAAPGVVEEMTLPVSLISRISLWTPSSSLAQERLLKVMSPDVLVHL